MRRRIAVGLLASAAVLGGACQKDEAGWVSCFEDEVATVAPNPDPDHGLDWVCVPLDDFADEDSIARLDAILAGRKADG